MFGRSAVVLVTALLMFPQMVETIYSPALTDISVRFAVSAQQAAQTLAVYFIGFALGVLFGVGPAISTAAVRRCWRGSRCTPSAARWRWR